MLSKATLLLLIVIAGSLAGSFFYLLSPFAGAALTIAAVLGLGLLFFASLSRFIQAGTTSWFAFFMGLLALIALGGLGYLYYMNPVHDLTTDPRNPPKFVHPVYPFRVEKGAEFLEPSLQIQRDYEPALAATQLLSFPGFEGVKVGAPAADVYSEALKVIREQLPEWTLEFSDGKTLHAEYSAVWSPYHFVNDIVLEVRADPKDNFQSTIDLRARNRLPLKSDFGVNIFILRDLKVRLALVTQPLENKFRSAKVEAEIKKDNPPETPPPAPAEPKPEENPEAKP